jgi:hypothetical protein
VPAPDDELVFVPNLGFRLARGGLQSPNTVVSRGAQTLTVGVTSDRDGTDIMATIIGVDEQLEFRKSRAVDAPITIVDDHGRVLEERPSRYVVSSHFFRLMEGPTQFQRMVALDRIQSDVRSLQFSMSGAAGQWEVVIPLEPVSREGPRGHPNDAQSTEHDVEISVTLVARTSMLTAIELETYDLRRGELPIDQAERWIEGIGTFEHVRGLGQDLLMLRDSTGAHHLERPHAVQDRARRARRREVVLFEAMPDEAVSASIEIPYVGIRERSDELKVSVPSDGEVTMNACRARVMTSRVDRSSDSAPGRPSPIEGLNGSCVRIVIAPIDPTAERQLVMVGVMESNDRGMSVSRSRADPPVIEVPDPSGDSEFITFKNPLIRVSGPWKLEFALPAIDAQRAS